MISIYLKDCPCKLYKYCLGGFDFFNASSQFTRQFMKAFPYFMFPYAPIINYIFISSSELHWIKAYFSSCPWFRKDRRWFRIWINSERSHYFLNHDWSKAISISKRILGKMPRKGKPGKYPFLPVTVLLSSSNVKVIFL